MADFFGSRSEGPDLESLVIGAAWSATLVFILANCLFRWYATQILRPARLGLSLIPAVLVAAITAYWSATHETGLLAGIGYLSYCLVASIALPIVLRVAYLRGPSRRRRLDKPVPAGDPLDT